jgi:group I intron endonuclease
MVIYLTTNLINGRKYLGKDEYNKKSYLGSGITLKKAIKKYGKENFKKEILEYCNNSQHLQEREEYWLSTTNAAENPLYYNRTNKSRGPKKGIKHITHKKGKDNKNWGKNRTEEEKKKMSQIRLGKPSGKLGYKCTEEQRINMSKPKSEEHINNLRNRTFSFETKQKMSISALGKSNYPKKPIIQYDLQGNFIQEWDSITEATNITKINTIGDCVRGKQKKAGNFLWKFKFM